MQIGTAWVINRSRFIVVKDELYVNHIRVRIWRVPSADYDSGWQDIIQGRLKTFDHNLGGPWNDYVVHLLV